MQTESSARRTNLSSISWKSPVLAILSLLFAILLAVAHHLFYTFWNGKPVANDTQQQWIVRGGTTFAFLVNSFMVVPMSYLFLQQVWLSLQKKPVKVSDIDTLFSATGNIFELFSLRVWLARPLLALTILAVWTIPIGSILPPGTLTVAYSQRAISQNMGVAEYDFNRISNYMPGYSYNAGGFPVLSSAGPELGRLFLASSSSMSILQQTSPRPNSTFTINTFAPAITCQSSSEMFSAFKEKWRSSGSDAMVQAASILFFSWVPQSSNATDIPDIYSSSFSNLDTYTNTSSLIYLYANTADITQGLVQEDQPALIACSLKNASYTLAFNFSNTQQDLQIVQREMLNDVSAYKIVNKGYYSLSQTSQAQAVAYVSLMQAFGRIITGSVFGEINHLSGKFYDATSTLVLSTSLSSTPGSWTNETFAHQTETIFQNATFSLLSSNLFIANSSATVPQNVTILENQNIYNYNPSSLLISYGIVVGVGLVAAITGVLVTLHNGLTFAKNFSTFLRTTRNPRLDSMVYAEDMNGAEPCGKHIEQEELIYVPVMKQGLVPGFIPMGSTELRNAGPNTSAEKKKTSSVVVAATRGDGYTQVSSGSNIPNYSRRTTSSYVPVENDDHDDEEHTIQRRAVSG